MLTAADSIYMICIRVLIYIRASSVREITHGVIFSSRLIAREQSRWRSMRLKSDELFVTSEDTA